MPSSETNLQHRIKLLICLTLCQMQASAVTQKADLKQAFEDILSCFPPFGQTLFLEMLLFSYRYYLSAGEIVYTCNFQGSQFWASHWRVCALLPWPGHFYITAPWGFTTLKTKLGKSVTSSAFLSLGIFSGKLFRLPKDKCEVKAHQAPLMIDSLMKNSHAQPYAKPPTPSSQTRVNTSVHHFCQFSCWRVLPLLLELTGSTNTSLMNCPLPQ